MQRTGGQAFKVPCGPPRGCFRWLLPTAQPLLSCRGLLRADGRRDVAPSQPSPQRLLPKTAPAAVWPTSAL